MDVLRGPKELSAWDRLILGIHTVPVYLIFGHLEIEER